MDQFDEFWRIFPHCGTRSKRIMAKAKWDEITKFGLNANIRDSEGNSMRVDLKASPAEIILGAKAYTMSLTDNDRPYVPGAQVWLTHGRWADFVDAETRAARYDRTQDHKAELIQAGKLRIVS